MPQESIPNANDGTPIVALLIVNQIPRLPKIAISSILTNSSAEIVVGYVSKRDLSDIPESPRIHFLDLTKYALDLNIRPKDGNYETFDDNSFFSLVQLKWSLFREILEKNPRRDLIYTDLDVFWTTDLAKIIQSAFMNLHQVNMFIQNFTSDPAEPQLCMGFVAFRNCPESLDLVDECSKLHAEMLTINARAGDDDVITSYYRRHGFPSRIQQLPQSTFPVGNLLNLFSKRSLYPGLIPKTPYLYHSNFVVGVVRKIETAFIFHSNQSLTSKEFDWKLRLLIKFRVLMRFFFFHLRKTVKSIVSKWS